MGEVEEEARVLPAAQVGGQGEEGEGEGEGEEHAALEMVTDF